MSAPDFLAGMAVASRARLKAQRAAESEAALLARARAALAAPALQLSPLGFDLIAEIKLRSPAAGALQDPAYDRRGRIEAGQDVAQLRQVFGHYAAAVVVLIETLQPFVAKGLYHGSS